MECTLADGAAKTELGQKPDRLPISQANWRYSFGEMIDVALGHDEPPERPNHSQVSERDPANGPPGVFTNVKWKVSATAAIAAPAYAREIESGCLRETNTLTASFLSTVSIAAAISSINADARLRRFRLRALNSTFASLYPGSPGRSV